MSDATPVECDNFFSVQAKYEEFLNPGYVIVNFGGAAAPADYLGWLELINERIGGAAVGAAGPDKFNVVAGSNQPLSLMDPSQINLNLLRVDTRANADFVAGQLFGLGRLHAWVLEYGGANLPLILHGRRMGDALWCMYPRGWAAVGSGWDPLTANRQAYSLQHFTYGQRL